MVRTRGEDGKNGTNQINCKQMPMGKGKVGRSKARYMDQVKTNLRSLKVQNWKGRARNRSEWRDLLELARIRRGLWKQS